MTKALKNKRVALEQALNARIVLDDHHRGGEYWVAITTLPEVRSEATRGGEGGGGEDGSATSPSASSETPPNFKKKPVRRSTIPTVSASSPKGGGSKVKPTFEPVIWTKEGRDAA